jgi:GNAT superfamily N-acetyltransferase
VFDGAAIAEEIGFTRGDGGFQFENAMGDLPHAASRAPTAHDPGAPAWAGVLAHRRSRYRPAVQSGREVPMLANRPMARVAGVVVDWVKLELDLRQFHADSVDVPELPGRLRISTLAALGDTSHHRRLLYELNKTCSADIPGRGAFFSYDEYIDQRFETPGFRPDGQILLIEGYDMAGMCALSYRPDRTWAFIEMTGVVPAYRKRGFATLLKVHALSAAQRWGARMVRTVNHPANEPIIAANRKLGFEDADFEFD